MEQKYNNEPQPIETTSVKLLPNQMSAAVLQEDTAMQEFIKSSIAIRELNPSQDVMPTIYYQETLLSKERQQIINAFTSGQIDIENYHENPSFEGGTTILISKIERAEQYFNNTFKK